MRFVTIVSQCPRRLRNQPSRHGSLTQSTMSTRGRSASPQSREMDVDMDKPSDSKSEPKVVVITNLTRNVVEAHLRVIFGFYGEVVKIDLPMYAKCAYDRAQFFYPRLTPSHSWPKQRKSRSGICQCNFSQHRRLAYEWWAAGRRRSQSRAVRHAPLSPNALPLPTTPAATATAERARARP